MAIHQIGRIPAIVLVLAMLPSFFPAKKPPSYNGHHYQRGNVQKVSIPLLKSKGNVSTCQRLRLNRWRGLRTWDKIASSCQPLQEFPRNGFSFLLRRPYNGLRRI
jgi:hypothetical protein